MKASDISRFLASGHISGPLNSVDQALHVIRSHLGMDVAFVSEFRDTDRVFRHVDAKGHESPLQVGDSIPLEEGYCQRVVDGRLPELIPDTGEVPAALAIPLTASVPIGAHLSVPIRLADGRVYGTFCCFSHTPDPSLNERDLQMMRAFADLAAFQIDRDLQLVRERETKLKRVRNAIDDGELSIVYQPIYDLDEDRIEGFECLSRFAGEPSRPPDKWFAEADEVGLGVELELAAIQLALKALPYLSDGVYITLNVSPHTICSEGLEPALKGVPAHRLVLEVTEHAPVDDYEPLSIALERLRRRGLRLAIDDAGSGYASLRHILRLKPDLIKLDIGLIRDIHEDGDKRAIVTAIIGFARQTGAEVLAEGVETVAELLVLRSLGVKLGQGYLLNRPMPLLDASVLAPARSDRVASGRSGRGM